MEKDFNKLVLDNVKSSMDILFTLDCTDFRHKQENQRKIHQVYNLLAEIYKKTKED